MTFSSKAYPQWRKLRDLPRLLARAGLSLCRVCDQWCTQTLCLNCQQSHQKFMPRCRWCALPCNTALCVTCLSIKPPWESCACAVAYAEPWRSLIIDFKFHENPSMAKFLSRIILANPVTYTLVHAADLLLPVPASKEKLRQRGFNPAQWLARSMAAHKCMDQALVKLRHTLPQSGLDHAHRLNNLTNSIAVNPLTLQQLESKHVVLIDDVMTTGSTLRTCTQALYAAGVQRVSCVVLARADTHSQAQSVSLD